MKIPDNDKTILSLLEISLETLADIALSDDLTEIQRRNKAKRIYLEIRLVIRKMAMEEERNSNG